MSERDEVPRINRKAFEARERLRVRYRPRVVRFLFVGEAPPASGRFFYQADSGLYRAMRDTFVSALPAIDGRQFLRSFQGLGCYLVDLCGIPVDQLGDEARHHARVRGEARLRKSLRHMQPGCIVLVVRSISKHVLRAEKGADWHGVHFELPYPGRWHHHRAVFSRRLARILRQVLRSQVPSLRRHVRSRKVV